MYLHIMKSDKFTEPYIKFINYNFNSKKHLFLVWENRNQDIKISQEGNVVDVKKHIKSLLYIIFRMNKSDKIFLHGLFIPYVILLLFIQPWLQKKCYWIIWGGDLYYYKFRNKTFKSNLYEFCRKSVIRNIYGLITHVKGDFELAKKWYGARGKYFYCFMYPSNLYKEYHTSQNYQHKRELIIQVGNSAAPTNNHIEVFKKLEKYKNKNIRIICPLSYGDIKYREKVISQGKEIFGNRFIPLIKFLPFEEYLELLAQIDVAIFNHKRQQAMGNIITLIGLGKKVYVRNDITIWEFMDYHGLKVFNSNSTFDDLFVEIEERVKKKNIENVKKQFSEEKLKEDWKKIFTY